jgi:hypothetical protein
MTQKRTTSRCSAERAGFWRETSGPAPPHCRLPGKSVPAEKKQKIQVMPRPVNIEHPKKQKK